MDPWHRQISHLPHLTVLLIPHAGPHEAMKTAHLRGTMNGKYGEAMVLSRFTKIVTGKPQFLEKPMEISDFVEFCQFWEMLWPKFTSQFPSRDAEVTATHRTCSVKSPRSPLTNPQQPYITWEFSLAKLWFHDSDRSDHSDQRAWNLHEGDLNVHRKWIHHWCCAVKNLHS